MEDVFKQPIAMNKTILQQNVLPSYPAAQLNPYSYITTQLEITPQAPVFAPNGVLTTTPYKTIKKDYYNEYARIKEPINIMVNKQLTATKQQRQPIPKYESETKNKTSIINNKNVSEITEVNTIEAETLTNSAPNYLKTNKAVNLNYKIDPSTELATRNKNRFNYISKEFDNMLPIYMKNNKTCNKPQFKKRSVYDDQPSELEHFTTNKPFNKHNRFNNEFLNNIQSTKYEHINCLYDTSGGVSNIQHAKEYFMNKFDNKESEYDYNKESFCSSCSGGGNKDENKQATITNKPLNEIYEFYDNEPTKITIKNDLEELDIYKTEQNKIETFTGATNYTTATSNYLSSLASQAMMLLYFVKNNEDFKPWCQYWNSLQYNLLKASNNGNSEGVKLNNAIIFQMLEQSDSDVAYVQNKGEQMKFRIRDTYKFVPLHIYTYVLTHEMAHLANGKEWGHGQTFQMLMHLLEVAGFLTNIIKLEAYPIDPYYSGGTPILTKQSIKEELYDGINYLIKYGGNKKYYNDLLNIISNK